MIRILIWILLLTYFTIESFSPTKSDFDAYGMKIAANDLLFVQAKGIEEAFLIQFAPYDNTTSSDQCLLYYLDSSNYIYSVGVGIKQKSLNSSLFYFFGEVITDGSSSQSEPGRNRTFIGIAEFRLDQSSTNVDPFTNLSQSSCDLLNTKPLSFLSAYDHQEYAVMGVEPYGQYALVLTTDFVFRYQPFSTTEQIISRSGNLTWPQNITFFPCAIDLTETYTIVAGFVRNAAQSRVRVTPTVYLMSNGNFSILSSWSYAAPNNSWQARLSYSGIGIRNNRYTMSVKINPIDSKRVLVGMPFLNTVFMFVVENDNIILRSTNNADNERRTGYGKSVTWLSVSQAAILDWSYTLDGKTFIEAEVCIYTSINDTKIPIGPDAVIPNIHQVLPSTLTEEWIRMISTPSSIAVMDVNGGTMLILSAQPGFFANTSGTDASVTASIPVISQATPCLGGTYKSKVGIHWCDLCPSGTRNSNGTGAVSCLNCSSDSFCPLGSLYEVNPTFLTNQSQAYAYPKTPDMNVFEDILLNNMFTLGSTGHCLVVSPIFWILILLFIFFVFFIVMVSLNFCMSESKRQKCRKSVKAFFRQADFVGEGELWLGGIASLCIVLMTIMAYHFALSFMNQYPSENVGPSTFACDPELRNSRYSSLLQSLAVPISDSEQPLFNLLDSQNFTLNIELLNTAVTCDSFMIQQITDDSPLILSFNTCSNTNGVLAANVRLRQQKVQIELVFSDKQIIGGVRLGLSGPGQQNDSNRLQELNFRKSFINPTKTLAQKFYVRFDMTKVINETESLSNDGSIYSGIWYPTFIYSESDMFADAITYFTSSKSSQRTITIQVDESTYFIKNNQSPIAKQAEVVFRTLLFVFLCLEFCAIGFLICKLILIPIIRKIYYLCCGRKQRKETLETNDEMKDIRF